MSSNKEKRIAPLHPDAVTQDGKEVELFEQYDGVVLEPKEIAFVDAYVGEARFNAAKAYRMVFGKSSGNESRMMHKPHILAAIKYRLDARGASAEAALAELAEVAFGEWQDFIDVKMRNGEVVSVRMDVSAKVRALELIMRTHGKLDSRGAVQNAVVVNINTPGLSEEDLA